MNIEVAVVIREASGTPILLASVSEPELVRQVVGRCAREADSRSILSESEENRSRFRQRARALRALLPETCPTPAS